VMVFFFVTYMGVLAVWCFMGAIVQPEVMLPYAIMMLALYAIISSNYSRLTGVMNSALEGIFSTCDHVLHVVTGVFLDAALGGVPGLAESIDMGAAGLCQAGLVALEQAMDDKLTEAAQVSNTVTQADLGTAEFRVAGYGEGKKALATDFIASTVDYSSKRQASDGGTSLLDSIQQAATTGKLSTGTLTYTAEGGVINPEIVVGNIYQGILDSAMKGVASMGTSTPSQDEELGNIANQLRLNPDTATRMRDAFFQAMAIDTVLPPVITPGDLADIRGKQLFDHFLKMEGRECSDVKEFLSEVQEQDMESFNAKTATSLSAIVNWPRIHREVGRFNGGTIPQVIQREIAEQLDPTSAGSATFKASSLFFELAAGFDPEIRKAYAKTEESRIFVDAGIVTEENYANADCREILDLCMGAKRDVISGTIAPSMIVAAARGLLIPPEEKTIDAFTVNYMWYEGFRAVLEECGFSEEEMNEEWLKAKWNTMTKGIGLFEYSSESDLLMMVQSTTQGRLWRTAVKAILFNSRIYGMAGCSKEVAKGLLLANNPADFSALKKSVTWPAWIEEKYAGASDANRHEDQAPLFINAMKVVGFMRKLAYDDDDTSADADAPPMDPNSLLMLNGLPTDITDMQWRFGDADMQTIWQCIAGKSPKRIRGLWLEATLDLFAIIDSVPADVDYFYEAVDQQTKWHEEGLKKTPRVLGPDGEEGAVIGALRTHDLQRWLVEIYLTGTGALTAMQFVTIINGTLQLGLPEVHLNAIFVACPWVKGDDKGELRQISDLGWGLKLWMGCGLWKKGCHILVQSLMPPGGMRDLALSALEEEFAVLDEASTPTGGIARGVLQVPHVFYLMKKVCHTGLTCDELNGWVCNELGMEIPKADMEQCFNLMDLNGDGVLSWQEFIPAFRYLITSYIPRIVLERMGLTPQKILMFVAVIGLNLGAAYLFVSLVFVAFTTGEGLASAMHSTMSAGMGAYQQVSSQTGGGDGGGSASAFFSGLVNKIKETMIITLGLSKAVADKLLTIAEEVA